ncbi:2-hydroxyacid dehydrogenase [Salinivibrio sp. MA351]|uniref:2-hydroxyacid dehydrogenase n=1 Tax=unclassified Salinivibrio TaxID=2636825 RepID=UPI000989648B|nr:MULTISPECIES: 2-hydroxyacid dehydrogenase [unclassified Salinivibrio]OOE99005.1 2-hydroxyacid dehydrogenase [Salinivibrio sp. MA351]OOF03260.1 2-hydroxyacid dehydrogenase [Salinivibrio sp. MA607]
MTTIAVFSAKSYDKAAFTHVNDAFAYTFEFHDFQLTDKTAKMAQGAEVVCAFVNDDLSRPVLEILAKAGTSLVALRCAGYDRVDLDAAKSLGITVVRVPAYSPESVAEHTVGMMMCLNRRFHKAYQRTRDANFELEGLVGFNFHGKTVGIIGTGKIGIATMRILNGLGMRLLCHDPYQNPQALELGAEYVSKETLYAQSDVVSLHCPMSKENYHLLSANAFNQMKDGVMVINTSRGELLDSVAAIEALKQGRIGSLGLDVYDNERDLFFQDKSNDVIVDDVFRRLSACHNVLITGHQAFLTKEALHNIAETTLANIQIVLSGQTCQNQIVEVEDRSD